MNTLDDLIAAQNLIPTDTQETVVSVGATATKVLSNNPNRVSYIIGNPSTTTVYFGLSATNLTTSQGIPVGGGNSLSSNWHDDMNSVGYELWAIAASGTVSLYVRETFGVRGGKTG